jgi:hypothetical protein
MSALTRSNFPTNLEVNAAKRKGNAAGSRAATFNFRVGRFWGGHSMEKMVYKSWLERIIEKLGI